MAISRCIHKPWMLLHCWIATGHSPGFYIWFWSWGDILFIILFGFVGTLGLVILQFCVAGYLVRDDWRHWFANLNLDSDHFNNQLEKRGQYCYPGQSCLIQLCILTSTEFAGWWSSKPCNEMGRVNWRALVWINKPYNFNSGIGNWAYAEPWVLSDKELQRVAHLQTLMWHTGQKVWSWSLLVAPSIWAWFERGDRSRMDFVIFQ